jgi:hypothetical protein
MLEDSLTSYGDLIPTASLRWNQGVNNYMVYVTGDAPVGDYDRARLANLGIGHGAIDAGAGYNFKNTDTQYRSGVDFHFDWGASHFLSKQVFVGFAGYAYQQITDDSGQNRFWAASDQASSESVRSSDTSSPGRHAGLSRREGLWRI